MMCHNFYSKVIALNLGVFAPNYDRLPCQLCLEGTMSQQITMMGDVVCINFYSFFSSSFDEEKDTHLHMCEKVTF